MTFCNCRRLLRTTKIIFINENYSEGGMDTVNVRYIFGHTEWSYWIIRRMQVRGSNLFTFNNGRMFLHSIECVSPAFQRSLFPRQAYIKNRYFVCSRLLYALYCYTKFVSTKETLVSMESIVPSDRSTVSPILPTNVSNSDNWGTAMFCLGPVSRILFKIYIKRSVLAISSCIMLEI